MKTFTILLMNLFLSANSICQPENNNYDPSCGFWRQGQNNIQNTGNSSIMFNWQFVQTPVGGSFIDVFFIDSLNGWAGHTANGCARTTDSGFNWAVITFNDTNFSTLYNGIYFIDQNTGWCVGGAIQIRKSTNGGASWFKQYGPPVAGINRGVFFFDQFTGYIIGSKSFPYLPFSAKSTNGGANWTELNVSFSNAQELNDQYWFNPGTGWICGYDVLLKTTNGGTNFVNLYSNVPPTGNGHNALLAINFINEQTGWIGAANLERNNIYKTTNGGANWFFQNNPVSQAGWNQINDVLFISSDSGWAAHGTPSTGAVMFTSNGGTNWLMDNTSYSWYDCLETFSRSKIWSGGSSGRMWYAILNEPVGIKTISGRTPDKFSVSQNYPNPFNPATSVRISLPEKTALKVKVFDVTGITVSTLIESEMKPGVYDVSWNGENYSSGVYFLIVSTDRFSSIKKMVLIK